MSLINSNNTNVRKNLVAARSQSKGLSGLGLLLLMTLWGQHAYGASFTDTFDTDTGTTSSFSRTLGGASFTYTFTAQGDGGDMVWENQFGDGNSASVNLQSGAFNTGTTELLTIARTDAADFIFTSLYIDNAGGTTVTVGGYLNGSLVGSAQTVSNGSAGTLNFGGITVDEVQISATDMINTNIDTFVGDSTANSAPTASGIPADVTVTEDTASDFDLSEVTFADADGDSLTVTLSAGAGTFAASSGGSVTVDGSGTGTLTLTGTAANITTYLDTASNVQYTGAADASGQDATTVTVNANDSKTDPVLGTINVDITAVNDAPTASGVPTDVTVTEDTASNFDLSAVTFADADGDSLTVTLSAGAGTFTASSGGGVTIGGSGTGALTLGGTAANINTFLDTTTNIQYTGAANASGNDATTVTVDANDGTVNPPLGTINVDITAVNDAPTASGVPTDVTVIEDTPSNFDLSAAAFADADGDSLTVTLSASAGTFTASTGGGVTVSGSGTGTLTLAGTTANISTFLDTASNIQYTGAADASGNDATTVTINANDGTVNPLLGTINVDITAVNDAPTDIAISSSTIAQSDTVAGADVGTLSSIDVEDSSFTYSLISPGTAANGACSSASDNSSFQINSSTLETGSSLEPGSYSLCIQTHDGTTSFEKSLTISVTDDVAPSGHSVSLDDGTLNGTEATSTSFTFASAEVGADYSYSIASSGGGAPVTGTGTIATATDQISGIDVSGLPDGTLTLSVILTDSAGNSASAVTGTATLDASAPTGHGVSFDDATLNGTEAASTSFTFATAEVGADYSYSIASSGGGAPVNGTGTIATATDQISGIDVSGLSDGTLTLSVTLTDSAGNSATAVTDTAILDASAPTGHSVSFDDATLNGTEATSTSFTFASAEVGAGYSYTIASSGGGAPVTGTGTIATATDQISGIDIRGLSDGTLTLSVTVTDSVGNSAAAVTDTATLDTTAPVANISTAASDPINAAFTASISFGEAMTGFTAGDISAANATLSDFANGGAGSYSVTVTPTSDGTVTLDVGAGVAQDSAGNDNVAAAQLSLDYDGSVPTPIISSNVAGSYTNAAFTATIDFGEAMTGFVVGDLTASNAGLSGFMDNGDGTYNVTVTPSADGVVTLDVAANVAQDGAANSNVAATQFSLTYDGTAPTLAGSIPSNGATNVVFDADIVLTFSEDVTAGTGSLALYAAADDSLVESFSAGSLTIVGNSVTVDPATTLSPTRSYYLLVDNNAFEDSAGNRYAGIADKATLSFTVVNSAPIANGDSSTLDEDQSVNIAVLTNDTDGDSAVNAASLLIADGPANGSTSINTGTGVITYTPDADFTGTDSFTYTVEDAYGAVSNPATVTMTVTNVNDAPVAENDTASTPEDNAVAIDVAADDSDIDPGDGVDPDTITIVAAPANGQAVVSGGQVTYTPNANFSGTDTFTYTIEDQSGAVSNVASVFVSVTGVNDLPTAVDDADSVDEDGTVTTDVVANDTDLDGTIDPTTVRIVDDVANGATSVDALTGAVTYIPDADFNGTDTFTYVVWDDADGSSAEATVTITVNSINDAPVALADTAVLQEDTPHDVNVLGNDDDVDGTLNVASVEVVTPPSDGATSVSAATGVITYTPDSDFAGSDSFTYRVMDDEGLWSSPATVTITVDAVNDAPLANDDAAVTDEDTATVISLLGNDSDVDGSLDPTSVVITGTATHGDVVVNADGTVSYTPNADYHGGDTFTYTVADDVDAVSNAATVTVTVNMVNDAPVITGTPATAVNEGEAYSFTPTATDVDVEDTFTFSVANMPNWASFDVGTGALTGVPGTVAAGTYADIVISVSDGTTSASLPAFSIEVVDTNVAPVIGGSAPAAVTVGQLYSFTPTVEDPDTADTLTFAVSGLPNWLSFNAGTGQVSGTPADAHVGNYNSIEISVSDGEETAMLAAFGIQVVPGADGDGDTISDYQEGLDGTNPVDPTDYWDVTPPVLEAPETVTLDAVALYTPVHVKRLLGLPLSASNGEVGAALAELATDNIDGDSCCEPAVQDQVGSVVLLPPGRNEVTWLAQDRMGNTSEVTQVVNIRPLVSMSKDQTTVEGATATFSVVLNGESPFYPLTVPFVIDSSSTAGGGDHNLVEGTVTFVEADGIGQTRAGVSFNVINDDISEDDKTLVIRLDDRTSNAEDLANGYDAANPDIFDINSGAKTRHRVDIVDGNLAPNASLQLSQGGRATVLVTSNGGPVTATVQVTDANVGDTATLDWSGSHNTLVDTDGNTVDETLVFDPDGLSPGRHKVQVRVTDSEGATNTARLFFRVVPDLPALTSDTDTDGDSVDDQTEGTADSDDDGIPDYLDNIPVSNVLPEDAAETGSYLVECDPGVRCRLGQFALMGESGGAQLTDDDIAQQDDLSADEEFDPVGGIFDFEVHDLPAPGQSVQIVVPQRGPIPDGAVYRKFQNGEWMTFVENENNVMHSAAGNAGYCPPPGDEAWEAGLISGYYCVQLTIEDGGPNDADGLVNAAVEDPGAVSVPVAAPEPPPTEETVVRGIKSTGGGGAVNAFFLIFLGGVMMFFRCTKKGTQKAVAASAKRGVLPLLLAATVWLPAQPLKAEIAADSVTVELGLYSSDSSGSASGFVSDMAADGITVDVERFDTSRFAQQFAVGYYFRPWAGIQLGYLNLGEVDVDIQAEAATVETLQTAFAKHYPAAGDGWTLGYRYQYPITRSVNVTADLGAFFWSREIDVFTDSIPSADDDGVDPVVALGLNYELAEGFSVGGRLQRAYVDDDYAQLWGAVLTWHF